MKVLYSHDPLKWGHGASYIYGCFCPTRGIKITVMRVRAKRRARLIADRGYDAFLLEAKMREGKGIDVHVRARPSCVLV
jgi:hypothetical protein